MTLIPILETLGTIVSLVAAIYAATGSPRHMKTAMALWTVGSVLWFAYGYMIGSVGLMLVNIGFFVIELVGLVRWMKDKT